MSINLLPRAVRVSGAEQKVIRGLKKTSLVVLIGYIVCVTGLFSYWMYWNIRDQSANTKLDALKSAWEDKRGQELVYRLVAEKLARAKGLINGKINMLETVSKVNSFLSPDISLESLNIASEGKIKVAAKSATSGPIAALEERAPGQADFVNVILSGLSRSKGGFSFELEMDLNKNSTLK